MALSTSGILGQLLQYGHCICCEKIMVIVEIPKCASVYISGLVAFSLVKQNGKVPPVQTEK